MRVVQSVRHGHVRTDDSNGASFVHGLEKRGIESALHQEHSNRCRSNDASPGTGCAQDVLNVEVIFMAVRDEQHVRCRQVLQGSGAAWVATQPRVDEDRSPALKGELEAGVSEKRQDVRHKTLYHASGDRTRGKSAHAEPWSVHVPLRKPGLGRLCVGEVQPLERGGRLGVVSRNRGSSGNADRWRRPLGTRRSLLWPLHVTRRAHRLTGPV